MFLVVIVLFFLLLLLLFFSSFFCCSFSLSVLAVFLVNIGELHVFSQSMLALKW